MDSEVVVGQMQDIFCHSQPDAETLARPGLPAGALLPGSDYMHIPRDGDRRRTQVIKALNDFGAHMQYSVFECNITSRKGIAGVCASG